VLDCLQEEFGSNPGDVWINSMCFELEALLQHGLKDPWKQLQVFITLSYGLTYGSKKKSRNT